MVGKKIEELNVQEPSKIELISLASKFGKGVEWVDRKLMYVSRKCLYEWLTPEMIGDLENSSVRRCSHINRCVLEDESLFRFEKAHEFHGACWLTMDEFSTKRAGEDLNVLILLEGSSAVGLLIPPRILSFSGRSETCHPAPAHIVEFELSQTKRNGEHIFVSFEGDLDNRNDSPIKSLCTLLGVHIKDLRRSLSRAVLKTKEEPWVPLPYKDSKFQLGFTIDKAIKERLIERGLDVVIDTVVRKVKTG